MIRLALAAFAVFLTATAMRAQDAGWGNIKGRVVWGPKALPQRNAIASVKIHGDKAHCLKDGDVLDEEWVVSTKTRGLRWTFVWLINADSKDKTPLPIHPDLQEIKNLEVEIDQPVCAFIPHAVGMRVGQVLVAKNSSPVAHNIKWQGSKNEGNVNVPAGGKFQLKGLVAERIPMPISCSIHGWMNGRVGVFNHPYFAVTDENGNFEIKNAPAGKYRLMVYNNRYLGGEKGNFGQPIVIPARETLDVGELAFTPP